jgi:glycosyltransferase 2 family protein
VRPAQARRARLDCDLGALEAALIAGLTGFGLASGPAGGGGARLRLVTFWLPILPGWLSLAWMQRNGEI